MSTAAAPTPIASRQLPLFEGHKVPRARLTFGGALELALTNTDDVALVKALELGAEGTITLAVDGHDREITLGAKCVGRCGARSPRCRRRRACGTGGLIVINDVRDGDDDDPED